MIRLLGLGFCFSLLATSTLAAQKPLKTGQLAPGFKLQGHDGKSYQLSDFKGKIVVLEWWNKDCPYVRKHYSSKNMQGLQKSSRDKGIVWLTMLSSAPGKQGYLEGDGILKEMTQASASPTKVLMDPEGTVGKAYNAKTTPHMYIINAKGELTYQGAIDSKPSTDTADIKGATNYVVLALNQMEQGKAVNPNSTKPYGCGIKYK